MGFIYLFVCLFVCLFVFVWIEEFYACVSEARIKIKLRNDFFFFFFSCHFIFKSFSTWLWMKLAILVLHARTKIGNSIRNKKRKTRQVVGAKRQQLGLY